jgi:hypothetical protein
VVTTALLVTSNGSGMGHLSRQVSVGLSAGTAGRTALFSLSLGLPQVLGLGIPGEYCPSYEREWMPRWFWNRYLRTRLVALCREIGADAVLFDGVAPYRGLISARRHLPDTAFLWMRRGMWLEGTGDAFLRTSPWFDTVLEPGDLGSAADRGPTSQLTDAIRIPPVSMLEVVPRLSRHEAATALGLDPDRPTILVTLGSGRLGDAAAPGRVVLETLLAETTWQVAVTTSGIATSGIPIPDPTRVVEVRGVYPLVRYLTAFDAVVSAAGYNAVHEFVSGGIPTLLVANRATRTDDQVARARGVAAAGLALDAAENDPAGLQAAVRGLLTDGVRADLVAAIGALDRSNVMGGAAAAWSQLVGTVDTRQVGPADRARAWWGALDDAARAAAMMALGPTGTAAVRRALRRPAPAGISDPLEVVISADEGSAESSPRPLLLSDSIGIDELRSGRIVEHVLPGTSESYRRERLAIIARNYRVVG